MNDKYFGTICLCALRYALGRQTYMPGIVQDFIRAHINEIDQSSIKVMIRDIDEADKFRTYNTPGGNIMTIDGLGDTKIDRPGWERLRDFLMEKVKDNEL